MFEPHQARRILTGHHGPLAVQPVSDGRREPRLLKKRFGQVAHDHPPPVLDPGVGLDGAGGIQAGADAEVGAVGRMAMT